MARNSKHPDYILIGTILILLTLGILILSGVSAALSQEKFGNTFFFLKHQLLFGLVPGLILAFILFKIRLDFLKKWSPILLLINIVFVGLVFLPKIGSRFFGSSRWINLGIFSFQPTEILKLTFILYLATWLTSRAKKENFRRREIPNKFKKNFSQTFIAFLVIIGIISFLLIAQPDIGTLGVIFSISALMYFSANTLLWQNFLIIFTALGGLILLIRTKPYRLYRLLVFLNPEFDPLGKGYQIKQALIAIGSGGIFGLGLGMSRQKFGFLPHSMSDAIFAIFAEETGFIGSLILIFLFLLFFWRGIKIVKNSSDMFSQLIAIGISSWIVVQAFTNIGSMIGVLPLTGIPLPFISYGGSHIITELAAIGILLNVSKNKS